MSKTLTKLNHTSTTMSPGLVAKSAELLAQSNKIDEVIDALTGQGNGLLKAVGGNAVGVATKDDYVNGIEVTTVDGSAETYVLTSVTLKTGSGDKVKLEFGKKALTSLGSGINGITAANGTVIIDSATDAKNPTIKVKTGEISSTATNETIASSKAVYDLVNPISTKVNSIVSANDKKITIKKADGSELGSFTTNSSTEKTITLPEYATKAEIPSDYVSTVSATGDTILTLTATPTGKSVAITGSIDATKITGFKKVQTAVTDVAAAATIATTAVTGITQNTEGVISVTKQTLPEVVTKATIYSLHSDARDIAWTSHDHGIKIKAVGNLSSIDTDVIAADVKYTPAVMAADGVTVTTPAKLESTSETLGNVLTTSSITAIKNYIDAAGITGGSGSTVTVTDTYSADGTDAISGKGVKAAIDTLDANVSNIVSSKVSVDNLTNNDLGNIKVNVVEVDGKITTVQVSELKAGSIYNSSTKTYTSGKTNGIALGSDIDNIKNYVDSKNFPVGSATKSNTTVTSTLASTEPSIKVTVSSDTKGDLNSVAVQALSPKVARTAYVAAVGTTPATAPAITIDNKAGIVTGDDLQKLKDYVDDKSSAAGAGDVNVIEDVKYGGTSLVVTSKAVNVPKVKWNNTSGVWKVATTDGASDTTLDDVAIDTVNNQLTITDGTTPVTYSLLKEGTKAYYNFSSSINDYVKKGTAVTNEAASGATINLTDNSVRTFAVYVPATKTLTDVKLGGFSIMNLFKSGGVMLKDGVLFNVYYYAANSSITNSYIITFE